MMAREISRNILRHQHFKACNIYNTHRTTHHNTRQVNIHSPSNMLVHQRADLFVEQYIGGHARSTCIDDAIYATPGTTTYIPATICRVSMHPTCIWANNTRGNLSSQYMWRSSLYYWCNLCIGRKYVKRRMVRTFHWCHFEICITRYQKRSIHLLAKVSNI